jgi:hypothetical protein
VNNAYRITRVMTPAASLALVTVDQVKEVLDIDPADTSDDAALTHHIDAVSQAINNWCDRIFVVQGYRDQLREVTGNFGEPLVMRQYPIVVDDATGPVVVVTQDGGVVDPTLLEVFPETGGLYRLDASLAPVAWAAALLVVDYTAGFEIIPPDVQSAALEWVTARWNAVGRDPALRRETIPDVIEQFYAAGDAAAGGAIPPGARDLLDSYRIWTV